MLGKHLIVIMSSLRYKKVGEAREYTQLDQQEIALRVLKKIKAKVADDTPLATITEPIDIELIADEKTFLKDLIEKQTVWSFDDLEAKQETVDLLV